MIQVETQSAGYPVGHLPMVLFARAPFLLTLRADMDPIPVAAGSMLALDDEAIDESPELCGALTALISVGALIQVHCRDSVH